MQTVRHYAIMAGAPEGPGRWCGYYFATAADEARMMAERETSEKGLAVKGEPAEWEAVEVCDDCRAALDPSTGCCSACGIDHSEGGQCPACGRRGAHAPDCPEWGDGPEVRLYVCAACGCLTDYPHRCTVCRSRWVVPVTDPAEVAAGLRGGPEAVPVGTIGDGEVV